MLDAPTSPARASSISHLLLQVNHGIVLDMRSSYSIDCEEVMLQSTQGRSPAMYEVASIKEPEPSSPSYLPTYGNIHIIDQRHSPDMNAQCLRLVWFIGQNRRSGYLARQFAMLVGSRAWPSSSS